MKSKHAAIRIPKGYRARVESSIDSHNWVAGPFARGPALFDFWLDVSFFSFYRVFIEEIPKKIKQPLRLGY